MGNLFTINIPCDTIFSNCRDCTVGKAKYICELEDNLVALQTAMEQLIEARNDVMMRVMVAEQQQLKRLNQVQGWLSRVQAEEIEVGRLISDSSASQEIQKLCLGGLCSTNCKSRYKFGKNVAKRLQAVAALKSEGEFKVVAERVPEVAVDERPADPTIVGLQSNIDEVWSCIGDEKVGILGLYGMAGVGKTTLLTQINNKFLNTPNDFDLVIWIVVSKDLQLEKIQETIGQKIGLCEESWKSKSAAEKAVDIFRVLGKKKFVLLLDDIWERVDLTKVGVPLPTPKIASKIVFTTRFIDVCGLMEANKKYKVECLKHEEAWKLFQTKLSEDILDSHPDISELAETVTRECCGLPLALITIGRAMAYKKTVEEWRYAIQVLSTSASNFPGIGKEVYPLLKFSYDSLPSDTLRSCFLYCSLYPEDYSIPKSDLIDCWIGEGFVDKCDRIGAQNQGYFIIGILLHACLLEEVDDDHVKMHDVIRDMALWITCEVEKEKENFLVYTGVALNEAPVLEKWNGVTRMSLMQNQIKNLTEIPTCPHLLTLFLNFNDLKTVTSGFFQFMPHLRVLNLSNNSSLTELPSGVSNLVSLEHLDLSWTRIKKLPKELGALLKLKCLNLEYMHHLHTIPRRLISRFSMLHVLRMFSCGSVLHVTEDSALFGGGEFLVEELLGLKYLNVLTIKLKNSHALQRFMSSPKLQNSIQSLSIRYLGESKPLSVISLASLKHLDALEIACCDYLEELEIHCAGEVQKIRQVHGFHSLRTVQIHDCFNSRQLTWLILAPHLKDIYISQCTQLEDIINSGDLSEVQEMMRNLNPFAKLEILQLQLLPNLKSIYSDALPFPSLKEIIIDGCPKLKKLPFDSNNIKERKTVIKGEEDWWKGLQWKDEATENAFSLCFKSISDD